MYNVFVMISTIGRSEVRAFLERNPTFRHDCFVTFTKVMNEVNARVKTAKKRRKELQMSP